MADWNSEWEEEDGVTKQTRRNEELSLPNDDEIDSDTKRLLNGHTSDTRETGQSPPTRKAVKPLKLGKSTTDDEAVEMKAMSYSPRAAAQQDEDEVVAFERIQPPPRHDRSSYIYHSNPTPPVSTMNYAPPAPEEYSDVATITPATAYQKFNELKRQAFAMKLFCIIQFLLLFFWIYLGPWWMIFFGLCILCGFWGAYKWRRIPVLLYIIYLIVNGILTVIFLLTDLSQSVISNVVGIFGFFVVFVELFIIHYAFQFWRALPSEGFQAFRQFLSSDAPTNPRFEEV